ncbi:hypothetical protein K9K77_03060 [Candidatus Babeliales bacterium]|nr:hypothetical protein [Candidatus Babeliales bacterium]
MQKNTVLILSLCSFFFHSYTHQFQYVLIEPKNIDLYLRPGTPTEHFPNNGDDLDLTEKSLREFTGGLIKGVTALSTVEDFLTDSDTKSPQFYEKGKKQGAQIGLGTAAIGIPLVLFAGKHTRSSDTMIIAGLAGVAGVAAAGGIGWMIWGNYMKTIVSFKNNLTNALAHMAELQGQLEELKKRQLALTQNVDKTLKFTEEVLVQMPALKEVTGDNARLASVMDFLLDRQQTLEKQFLSKIERNLTPDEITAYQTESSFEFSSESLTRIGRQRQALKAYNKAERNGLFQKDYKKFSQIPKEWLSQSIFNDLV